MSLDVFKFFMISGVKCFRRKLGVAAGTWNSSAGEVEAGKFLERTGQVTWSLLGKLQAKESTHLKIQGG